jgi:large subunit ribosomal protein L10Ae
MSKVSKESLNESIATLLKYSREEKKRKFLETVELQIALKNYDPSRDKRFAGSVR